MDLGILSQDSQATFLDRLDKIPSCGDQEESEIPTETKLIYGLTDIFKECNTCKLYELSERIFKQWQNREKLFALEKVVRILARKLSPTVNRLKIAKQVKSPLAIIAEKKEPPKKPLGKGNTLKAKQYATAQKVTEVKKKFEDEPSEICKLSASSGFFTYSNPNNKDQAKDNSLLKRSPQFSSFATVHKTTFSESRQKSQSTFDKLYQEHERRTLSQEKREIVFHEHEMKRCTFSPQLSATKSYNQSRDPLDLRPCYEKLHELRTVRNNTLDKRRKEIIDKEQKNRKITSNRKISYPNTSRVQTVKESMGGSILSDQGIKTSENAFMRLYNQDKVYKEKKKKLTEKVMIEEGVRFFPSLNNLSLSIVEDGRLIERNETFLRKKHEKIIAQTTSGPKDCTFKPNIRKSNKAPLHQNSKVSQKLNKYYEHHERRKAELQKELKY